METSRATLAWWFLIHHKKYEEPLSIRGTEGFILFVLWIWYFLCLTALYHMCFLFAIFQHTFKAVFLYAVLLYTHACTVTWFCRCFAFQIGKICYQKCIVRNFQFRKFLPVYSNYAVTVPPCANSNWFCRCFPDWHNPLPPLYCTEFSVQKIPACVQ